MPPKGPGTALSRRLIAARRPRVAGAHLHAAPPQHPVSGLRQPRIEVGQQLVEGEDDALVDGAAFQLAVGLGGLLHGHGLVRAQAEPTVGQQGHRLIQGTGSTVGRGLGQRDAEVSGGRVGQGDDPLGAAGQGDRVGRGAGAGRRRTEMAGRGLVSPPPGASRQAAGASLVR